jgi:hypothetical protein
MNGRRFRSLVLVALILIAASAFATQLRMDIPVTVSPNRWVPLTDKAGIALIGEPEKSASKPAQGRGQLWVKMDGSWVQVSMEPARELVPAQSR